MDFPAFSSICSSNKAECGVKAVWISVFFCSSCRFVWGILCRWEDEEKKRQKVKESKSQRDEGTKRQRDKGTKGQREEGRKGRRDKGSKKGRDKGTKRGRDKGTRRRKPRHLLFVSYSLPLHRPIRSILFNLCPKTFARFVSKTVLHNRTPLCESSVKVDVGGKLWE